MLENIRAFFMALPGATHVVQWGGADVYKVGGKVFAVIRGGQDGCAGQGRLPGVTFKASETSFEMLRNKPGLRPAPYLASRGLKWLQWIDGRTLDVAELYTYLRHSHAMAMAKLPGKARQAIAGAIGAESGGESTDATSKQRL